MQGSAVLLSIARLQISLDQKENALEILAFIITRELTPEAIEDEAERLIFDLETTLEPGAMEEWWERGKNHSFDSLVRALLAR